MFLAVCLISADIQAQTDLNIVPEASINNDLPIYTIPTESNAANVNSAKVNTANEPVPSPEDQGFIKLEMNGKHTYMKKVGDVIIEYKPD